MSAPDPEDNRATMNVSLTPELKRYVEEKVDGGTYTSASEVICAGLRLLAEEDKLRAIRREDFEAKVRVGLEELKRGEGVDGDAVFERLDTELEQEEKRSGKR